MIKTKIQTKIVTSLVQKRAKMKLSKMACCWKTTIILICFLILQVSSKETHVFIKDSKYQTFVHNIEKQYFLDKGETIEVWGKVIPFPWQDNRLIAGISDPELLEFNASCVEEVVSKGVITSNLTTQIGQVNKADEQNSLQAKTRNATFFIKIFDEIESLKEIIQAETDINVGCPPKKTMDIQRNVDKCALFENYTFIIPSGHYKPNSASKQNENNDKVIKYNFQALGCPIEANYYNPFKPPLQLYESGMFLRDVTANIVLFELNGRTDYSFMATMAQVRCLREAQSWEKLVQNETDISQSWTKQNYKSCFISDSEPTNPYLNQPYEIINKTGLSAITWHNEGIYIFKATVVDSHYSFCNLTAEFAVRVFGIESSSEKLVPFLVLGTSSLGLISTVVILFVTSKYYDAHTQ